MKFSLLLSFESISDSQYNRLRGASPFPPLYVNVSSVFFFFFNLHVSFFLFLMNFFFLCNMSMRVNLYKLFFLSSRFFSSQPSKRVFHLSTFPSSQPNTPGKTKSYCYPPTFPIPPTKQDLT